MNTKKILQTLASEWHISIHQLMTHYAMERFLYRLSKSKYANQFYLKGGMLLMGLGAPPARTTMDIDLLGCLNHSPEHMEKVFRDILHTKPGINDDVIFSDNLEVSVIMPQAIYTGVRIETQARVAGTTCALSIDVGFSDEIYPKHLILDYPSTIRELPQATLNCYPTESIIAEKWQTIVQLGSFNSRMKDFYDLWFLSHSYTHNLLTLKEAILRTFARRKTSITDYQTLTDTEYCNRMQGRWAGYIRKLKAGTYHKKPPVDLPSREFSEVIHEILSWLLPVLEQNEPAQWLPGKGWIKS